MNIGDLLDDNDLQLIKRALLQYPAADATATHEQRGRIALAFDGELRLRTEKRKQIWVEELRPFIGREITPGLIEEIVDILWATSTG